jgi:hypothetical protein
MDPPTKFHLYPLLPAEIKLMIWELAWEELSRGAHRFKLTVNSKNPTKIILEPDKSKKDDASAWRVRRNFDRIDSYCFYVQLKFERGAVAVYKNTAYNRKARVGQNDTVAMVHTKNDLVTFRFHYGTSLASLIFLTIGTNAETFAGITQIAIERDLLIRGFTDSRQRYLPFRCPCDRDHARHTTQVCCMGILRFFRLFKHLRAVYVIFPLANHHIKKNAFGERKLNAARYTTMAKSRHFRGKIYLIHGITMCVVDSYKVKIDLASQKNLRQFRDGKGTYCEVLQDDIDDVFTVSPWDIIDRLRARWEAYRSKMQGKQGKSRHPQGDGGRTEFKALVRCD